MAKPKGINRAEYRSYRKWIHGQLFSQAHNPLAMYQTMTAVAEGEDENYEAAQAVKDELALYLAKVEETGCWPYSNIYPGDCEQVGQDIEELKRLLAAVPA